MSSVTLPALQSMRTMAAKALFLLACVVLTGCDQNANTGTTFHRQVQASQRATTLPLPTLAVMQGYERTCVVPPYAIRASTPDASFAKLFGDIDYMPIRQNIQSAANDDSAWTLYLVKGRDIGAHIRLISNALKVDPPLTAGCYETQAICFINTTTSGRPSLTLSICEPKGAP